MCVLIVVHKKLKLEMKMKNRWVALMAGILIQTVLGGIYAWSTFAPFLERCYGLSKGQCGFIFGVTIASFTLAMTQAGHVMARKGPRFTVAIGALLFMTGYLLASISNGYFPVLLVSLGVVSGIGIGFGYACPLSVAMKWFPQRKGLVTGVSVAGFGGGAILLSSTAAHFLQQIDLLVFFRFYGISTGVILLISAFFLTEPTTTLRKSTQVKWKKEVISWPFFILATSLFAGTFSGLLVIGNLVPIVVANGLPQSQAVIAITIFSLGNVLGRVFWGHVFDKINYKCIPLSLICFALFTPPLLLSLPHWVTMLAIGLLGFAFGANFVIYASATSLHFGTEYFSILYPLCFLSYGIAGMVGPFVGGWLADGSGAYNTALYLSISVLVIAAILASLRLSVLKLSRDGVTVS